MPARCGPGDGGEEDRTEELTRLRIAVAKGEMTVTKTDEGLVFEAVAPAAPASEERRRLPMVDQWHEPRPRTRGECESARGVDDDGKVNPCPWVSCFYHLAIEVNFYGEIRFVAPTAGDDWEDLNLDAMTDTCALDIADREEWKIDHGMNGGLKAHEVAAVTRLSVARVNQIERSALRKFKVGALEWGMAPDDEGRTFKPRAKTQEEVDDDGEESESPKPVPKPRIMRGTLFDNTAEWKAAESARTVRAPKRSEPKREEPENESAALPLFGESEGAW